tara:strand:- start:3545 stop:3883 length:339 start_codon:yes stop_codon:yes gene_type:complete
VEAVEIIIFNKSPVRKLYLIALMYFSSNCKVNKTGINRSIICFLPNSLKANRGSCSVSKSRAKKYSKNIIVEYTTGFEKTILSCCFRFLSLISKIMFMVKHKKNSIVTIVLT